MANFFSGFLQGFADQGAEILSKRSEIESEMDARRALQSDRHTQILSEIEKKGDVDQEILKTKESVEQKRKQAQATIFDEIDRGIITPEEGIARGQAEGLDPRAIDTFLKIKRKSNPAFAAETFKKRRDAFRVEFPDLSDAELNKLARLDSGGSVTNINTGDSGIDSVLRRKVIERAFDIKLSSNKIKDAIRFLDENPDIPGVFSKFKNAVKDVTTQFRSLNILANAAGLTDRERAAFTIFQTKINALTGAFRTEIVGPGGLSKFELDLLQDTFQQAKLGSDFVSVKSALLSMSNTLTRSLSTTTDFLEASNISSFLRGDDSKPDQSTKPKGVVVELETDDPEEIQRIINKAPKGTIFFHKGKNVGKK